MFSGYDNSLRYHCVTQLSAFRIHLHACRSDRCEIVITDFKRPVLEDNWELEGPLEMSDSGECVCKASRTLRAIDSNRKSH